MPAEFPQHQQQCHQQELPDQHDQRQMHCPELVPGKAALQITGCADIHLAEKSGQRPARLKEKFQAVVLDVQDAVWKHGKWRHDPGNLRPAVELSGCLQILPVEPDAQRAGVAWDKHRLRAGVPSGGKCDLVLSGLIRVAISVRAPVVRQAQRGDVAVRGVGRTAPRPAARPPLEGAADQKPEPRSHRPARPPTRPSESASSYSWSPSCRLQEIRIKPRWMASNTASPREFTSSLR